jgi:hypothetical protein
MQWSGYELQSFFTYFPVIGKSEPECATTLEQVRVTTGSKKTWVYSGALEELAVSAPLVAPIVLP